MLTSSYIFFSGNIFNVFIIFIWFDATYIIPNFYHIVLYCDRAIFPTLGYQNGPSYGVSYFYVS